VCDDWPRFPFVAKTHLENLCRRHCCKSPTHFQLATKTPRPIQDPMVPTCERALKQIECIKPQCLIVIDVSLMTYPTIKCSFLETIVILIFNSFS